MIKVTAVGDDLTYEAETEDMQLACAEAANEFSLLWPNADNFILDAELPDGTVKRVQANVVIRKEFHLSELDA